MVLLQNRSSHHIYTKCNRVCRVAEVSVLSCKPSSKGDGSINHLKQQIRQFQTWVQTHLKEAAGILLVGWLMGLLVTLLYDIWNWTTVWTSIAALANVALAYATFSVIRRDSKILKFDRTPNLVAMPKQDETRRLAGEQWLMPIQLINLSSFPIYVFDTFVDLDGSVSRRLINSVVPVAQSTDIGIVLPGLFNQGEFRTYFKFGATGDADHMLRVTFTGVKRELDKPLVVRFGHSDVCPFAAREREGDLPLRGLDYL
jgi:hypothetical protein